MAPDSYMPSIIKYLEGRGISWVVWCFDPQWGPTLIRNWNYDLNASGEFAKAAIVNPLILQMIERTANFPVILDPREPRIVHAGFEHTYGYIFSTLKTPYGYKRARWVRNEIETGFGGHISLSICNTASQCVPEVCTDQLPLR